MNSFDRHLFFAINNGWKSSYNDLWLGNATWIGNGWIAFPIAVIALFLLDRQRFRINLIALALAGIVGGIALSVIKNAVHTPRPLQFYAADIEAGRVYINVMFERLYVNSFPSGHTQTVFTIATVLVWSMRRAGKSRWWNVAMIFAIATIVGVSRVYAGAHFPVDVAGGAVLGAVTAILCCSALEVWMRRKRYEQRPAASERDPF